MTILPVLPADWAAWLQCGKCHPGGRARFGFDRERKGDRLYWYLYHDSPSGRTYGHTLCALADPEKLGFHVLPGGRQAVAIDLWRARRQLRERVRQEDDKWRAEGP
jgi:hypothetical protein